MKKKYLFFSKSVSEIWPKKKIIAFGAAHKASTFLNFCKINTNLINYVVDDTKITRNNGGAILITTNTPIIKASLQSQAFIYEDYRKAIDTSFSELVGKM